jgi:sarcosine oxidase subunit alpha
MRILDHPILGRLSPKRWIEIEVDGERVKAIEGEPIATALIASGGRFQIHREILGTRGYLLRLSRCWEQTNQIWNGWVCGTAPLAC